MPLVIKHKRKIFFDALILSLLFSAVAEVQCVNSAFADIIGPSTPEPPASIYIMSDGSLVGTDNIRRNGNVYTFTANISGTVVVRRDGVIIEGAGYTLQGDGNRSPVIAGSEIYSAGIFLQSRNNVVIKNLKISNFSRGIELALNMMYNSGCQNINISGNTITNNEIGIYCANSENNVFSGNSVTDNTYGISFSVSNNNFVIGNIISGNNHGIEFYYSCDNIVYLNNFINNARQAVINQKWGMPSVSRLDNGSLGNYWNDYVGNDMNGDFVGDNPYVIDANNTDYYPLMNPWDTSSNPSQSPEPQQSEPESFPTALAAIASGASAAIVGVGLLAYFRKRNH
jgi:parallel beta-helix repeat protein